MKNYLSVFLLAANVFVFAQQVTPLHQFLVPPAESGDYQCLLPETIEQIPHLFPAKAHLAELLDWPLDKALHDNTFILNYYDNEPGSGTFTDYQCNGLVGYDGHNGTDLGLYSFRDMDRGTAILAAADGVVSSVTFHFGDRNYGVPYPDNGNGVVVDHADGSRTIYWHLRTNSATVNLGESVSAGQMLGYIGSSGWSPQPHLHLTTRIPASGQTTARDPFEGSCNEQQTLWNNPEPYVGGGTPEIFSGGIFSLASIGGSLSSIPLELFREHPLGPTTVGREESGIGVWIMVRGSAGSSYSVDLFRPDGSLYNTLNATISNTKYGWLPWWIDINSNTNNDDFGEWSAVARVGNAAKHQFKFNLGETTAFAPRFWRVGARSMRINGTVQHDTLRVTKLAAAPVFQLQNAPAFVSLTDSVVTFAATSDQSYRSTWFQVIATNDAGSDTMRYHIVDPGKPFNPATAVRPQPENPVSEFHLYQNYPNPFNPTTTIEFDLPAAAVVSLDIFDILGRQVETPYRASLPSGTYKYTWNATDAAGNALASGIYIYRLQAGSIVRSGKMLLVR